MVAYHVAEVIAPHFQHRRLENNVVFLNYSVPIADIMFLQRPGH